MTYRERRQARAERLAGWGAKRTTDAAAALQAQPELRHDWAFITQPGHIPERARMIARDERAYESLNKGRAMLTRAAGIEAQLERAIYDDDPDAVERLTEKMAGLIAKRDAMKDANAAFRKAHKAELAALGAYKRDQAMPHQGYELTNLGATIRATAKRIEALAKPRVARTIYARRAGSCPGCAAGITPGETITEVEPGRWLHAACAAG